MSLLGERPDWHAQTACRGGVSTVIVAMFPERGGETASARALCAVCPVAAECLQFALDNGERHGIWGGVSERQRRTMRRVERTGSAVPVRIGEPRPCPREGCDRVITGAAVMDAHRRAHQRADDFAAQVARVAELRASRSVAS